MALGKHCARQRHDRLLGGNDTLRRFNPESSCAVIDPIYRAPEDSRKTFATGGNRCAVTLDNTPVHASIIKVIEVARRHEFELGTADVGAYSADKIVPASARLEQGGCRNVRFLMRTLTYSRIKIFLRFAKLALIFLRKSEWHCAPLPWRWSFIDCTALLLSDCHPRIAIGGVQPAATKIKRRAGGSSDSPCSAP